MYVERYFLIPDYRFVIRYFYKKIHLILKLIKTPWGKISPEVNLFPIYYLLFIYGFIYILPYGEHIVGLTWFNLLKIEDGPLEWLQFSEYLISSIFGIVIYFKSKHKNTINSFVWLILSAFCFFVAAEEISWGERITGFSINSNRNKYSK